MCKVLPAKFKAKGKALNFECLPFCSTYWCPLNMPLILSGFSGMIRGSGTYKTKEIGMNFMDINDLAETLEEHFPESISFSGDHIFVTREDGKEFNIWVTEFSAEVNGVEVDRREPLVAFADDIAVAINDYIWDVNESEVETAETPAQTMFDEAVSIKKQIADFSAHLEPFKNRFHAFLAKTEPSGYLTFSTLEMPADEYSADFNSATSEGVIFSTEVNDWDNEEMFFMPFEYVNDPEKWETDLTNRMWDDRSLALQIFRKVTELNEYSLRNVSAYSSKENEKDVLIVDAEIATDGEETCGVTNAVFVVLKNEKVVYHARDYFDTYALANGLVQPIGSL